MITIRAEKPGDASRFREVNELAFGRAVEADIVDALRLARPDALSLVAEESAAGGDGDTSPSSGGGAEGAGNDGGTVVGYLLFTPATVVSRGRRVAGMGLAPLAVIPNRQRQGIGSALVRRGLDILRESTCPFVVVLGHPAYYPRFGFEPAAAAGLSSQWDGVPDEAFMALVLDAESMRGVSGVARYREEFDAAV